MTIMNKIQQGYQQFREDFYPKNKPLYTELVEQGQSPKIMLITCSDSRISTSLMMNTKPGDLFMVRNVANLVPNYQDGAMHLSSAAALEYAVCVLKVEHIVVMGHSQCGGIAALMKGEAHLDSDSTIKDWITVFNKAKKAIEQNHATLSFDEQCHQCELQALSQSLENLKDYPWVKQACADNRLQLHAWYFDISSGVISTVNPESHQLTPLDQDTSL